MLDSGTVHARRRTGIVISHDGSPLRSYVDVPMVIPCTRTYRGIVLHSNVVPQFVAEGIVARGAVLSGNGKRGVCTTIEPSDTAVLTAASDQCHGIRLYIVAMGVHFVHEAVVGARQSIEISRHISLGVGCLIGVG